MKALLMSDLLIICHKYTSRHFLCHVILPGLRGVAEWIVTKVSILLDYLLRAIMRKGIHRCHRVTASCIGHS